MDRACSTNGGDEECAWESQKEIDHKEDQGVRGWTILKWILQGWDGRDWIELAQDKDQWKALVNTVMNLWVP
jgi:hypothetical protein